MQFGYWDIAYAYQTIETPHKAKDNEGYGFPLSHISFVSHAHMPFGDQWQIEMGMC